MDHFNISETFPTQNLAPATCGHWFSLYVSKQGVLPTSSLTHPALSPSSSSVWNMTWPHQDFCFIFVINWILLLCNSDRQKHKNKEASPVPPMAPHHSLSNRTCSWGTALQQFSGELRTKHITWAQCHQAEKIITEKLLIAVGAGLLAAYRVTCQLLRLHSGTNGIFCFLVILTCKDSNL